MLHYLVFVGAAIQMIGIALYIKETVKGNNKPNRMTWLMWTTAPLIGAAAGYAKGVGLAVLPVFMAGFGPLLVFIASFVNPQSYWKLQRFDYLCGLCSILALILWGITKEPIVAIVFAIASDLFAAVPTFAKAWKYPSTETISPYASGLFGALTSFTAIKTWSFAAYAFPGYLVLLNCGLIFTIRRIPRR